MPSRLLEDVFFTKLVPIGVSSILNIYQRSLNIFGLIFAIKQYFFE